MSFCTDEEIYEELRKLGHNDVSPELFNEMKKDLISLVSDEKSFINDSPSNLHKSYHSEFEGLSRSLKSLNVGRDVYGVYSEDNNINPSYARWKNVKRPLSYEYQSAVNEKFPGNNTTDEKLPDISHNSTECSLSVPGSYNTSKKFELTGNSSKEDICTSNFDYLPVIERSQISPRMTNNSNYHPLPVVKESEISMVETENNSATNSSVETSLSNYKNIFKNYRSNNKFRLEQIENLNKSYSQSDIDSLINSGKLKRKVLRHKDGKPTITEELVDIPTIFNSSYPETTFDSSYLNTSDSSFKSNSSTGSLVALSPDSLTPRSTLSLSTKPRASYLTRKKKNDPVAMYNYYKKFWDNFKPPGEKNHNKLRWAIRDRMLDYSL